MWNCASFSILFLARSVESSVALGNTIPLQHIGSWSRLRDLVRNCRISGGHYSKECTTKNLQNMQTTLPKSAFPISFGAVCQSNGKKTITKKHGHS